MKTNSLKYFEINGYDWFRIRLPVTNVTETWQVSRTKKNHQREQNALKRLSKSLDFAKHVE